MWYGIQRTTFVDFPGKIAATLFTGGCNFRCPWCHNQDLVYPHRLSQLPQLDEEEIKHFLIRRKHLLEGICITGGEPTLWGERLLNFLAWAKSIGYETKVDTNGSHPEWVEEALKEDVVDFFAMDIKHPWETYHHAIGRDYDIHLLKKTISLITQSGKPHQFRTTLIPGLSRKTMLTFAQEMNIDLVFQPYRDPHPLGKEEHLSLTGETPA
ncbi:MAG: anaerobic ribonucleoside-triphosphate reductase activating protein [Brevinematales bacterium]|nr:anaerobic ribonucleoside-triphosphate reductase activating protein [Brevinematales bacterium]